MVINYYKMSGEELKRIFDISGFNGDQFAERLGIKRTKLYNEFGKREISAEVEKKLISDPELSSKRQLFKVTEQVSEQSETSFSPGYELWAKTIEMLQETMKLIVDDNKFIKEDAEVFRSVVKRGVEEGAIIFKGLKPTK